MLYLHQLPGRLRIRSPLLVGDEGFATVVRAGLANIRGVTATRTSVRTGSVLVEYNPELTNMAFVWAELRRLKIATGIFGFPLPFSKRPATQGCAGQAPLGVDPVVKDLVLLFGKIFLSILVQHGAKRSALLLLKKCL